MAALRFCPDMIRGKNVCCILSGSNNDVYRMLDIQRRSREYEEIIPIFKSLINNTTL